MPSSPPGAVLPPSAEALRLILDGVADGITVQDGHGQLLYANAAAAQYLGFASAEEFLAAPIADIIGRWEIFDAEGNPVTVADLPGRRALMGEHAEMLLRYVVKSSGDERWSLTKSRPIFDADGNVTAAVNIFTDVSELRTATREREEWRAVIEASPDGMVGADQSGRIVLVNAQAERMFGYDRDDLMGKAGDMLLPERLRTFLNSARRDVIGRAPGTSSFISRADLAGLRDDGSEFPIAVAFARFETVDGPVLLATIRDITERKAAEERIAYLAYHDALTGLPNRAMLEQHLERALDRVARAGTVVALFFIDLDEFKEVNDSLGHPAGDELLRQVATRLRTLTRGADLLARQGGDEFLLLVDDLEASPGVPEAEAARRIAERIHESFGEPFPIDRAVVRIGATVGVSLHPSDAPDADGLLRHADAALYAGKAAGRGRSVLYGQMSETGADRLSLTTRLRRAVAEEEFVLHFQPICDLSSGALVGTEALVRWQDPERGLLLPGEFIGAAESLGLIGKIGDWVMRDACRQAAEWQGRVPVSFNISPHEARDPRLVVRLLEQVARWRLDTEEMTVELTESAADDGGIQTLVALAQAGFSVAIDDFGTGHSSLARLAQLPVSVIKVDRQFVAGLDRDDPRARPVVHAILELARALRMRAVAEGIETAEQLAALRDLGCQFGQGYLLARPVPAGEVPLGGVALPAASSS